MLILGFGLRRNCRSAVAGDSERAPERRSLAFGSAVEPAIEDATVRDIRTRYSDTVRGGRIEFGDVVRGC